MTTANAGSIITFSTRYEFYDEQKNYTATYKFLVLSVVLPLKNSDDGYSQYVIYNVKYVGQNTIYNWGTPIISGTISELLLYYDYDRYTGKLTGNRVRMTGGSGLDPISNLQIS